MCKHANAVVITFNNGRGNPSLLKVSMFGDAWASPYGARYCKECGIWLPASKADVKKAAKSLNTKKDKSVRQAMRQACHGGHKYGNLRFWKKLARFLCVGCGKTLAPDDPAIVKAIIKNVTPKQTP